jgi:hypothetical protein
MALGLMEGLSDAEKATQAGGDEPSARPCGSPSRLVRQNGVLEEGKVGSCMIRLRC